jgi:hypothetical protein
MAAVLYGVLSLSTFCFWAWPQAFYWRAWEYFSDIVNKNCSVAPEWRGSESGDLSRRNLMFYQKAHPTLVTTDDDGFRSTPPLPGPHSIVMLGDSTIFGSGLSDEETLPWRLAKELGTRVFNGARQEPSLVMGRDDLKAVTLLIEGRTERSLGNILASDFLQQLAYRPLRQGELGLLDSAPLQLYFFPSIADHLSQRLGNDIQDLLYTRGRMAGRRLALISHRHAFQPEQLKDAVAAIKQRRDEAARRGYVYTFLPVPAAQTIYATDVDDFTRNFIPNLCQELNQQGVPCVNVASTLIRHKDEELWQYADTHWNARATELAAKELAVFLRQRGLVSGERVTP